MTSAKYQPLVDDHNRSLEAAERKGGQQQPPDHQHANPEQAKQQAWKQGEYNRRQQERAEQQEREAKRLEHLRAHDRPEFERQVKEQAVRDEWKTKDKEIREDPNNRWSPKLSDHARETVEQARTRESHERERDRNR